MSHNIAGAADFVRALEEVLPELSKGQKRIAGYILENYDKAAYMTAQTLGETVGVSESTVVRFATELGFEGYPQLQAQVRETVRVRLTTVQRIEATNDRISDENVLATILQNDADKIRATLDTIESGTMTGDLAGISVGVEAHSVDSETFIKAIAARL